MRSAIFHTRAAVNEREVVQDLREEAALPVRLLLTAGLPGGTSPTPRLSGGHGFCSFPGGPSNVPTRMPLSFLFNLSGSCVLSKSQRV